MSFARKLREIEEMDRRGEIIDPDKVDPRAYKSYLWRMTPDGRSVDKDLEIRLSGKK